MDYQQYSVEDFVLDEAFRKWVQYPDTASHRFWNQWLGQHPQKAETVAEAIELLRQLPVQQYSLSEQQKSSIIQAVEQGIDEWENRKQSAKQEKSIPISAYAITRQKLEARDKSVKFKPLPAGIAVCIVIALGMLYVIYQEELHEKQQPEVVYEQVVKENPKGQKLTVFLSDGSQVMLNAGSRLSFTKPFAPDRRTVTLEGEAFFKVAKDSLRPFQVISGELTTTALGTGFNIAAYPEDDHIHVSLSSGKVKVNYQQTAEELEQQACYLLPGEQVVYDREKQRAAREDFDTEKVLAWKEDVIYLENADQATALKTLERWYGIQIAIEGKSTVSWSVSAKFNNQSLKSVLTSLSYTMGFDFEIKDDEVIIKYVK